MNAKTEKLQRIVGRQEQYSRRNCLLLHFIAQGEPENPDDLVLETLNEKMHVDLTLWLIQLSVLVRRRLRVINQEQPSLNLLAITREKKNK